MGNNTGRPSEAQTVKRIKLISPRLQEVTVALYDPKPDHEVLFAEYVALTNELDRIRKEGGWTSMEEQVGDGFCKLPVRLGCLEFPVSRVSHFAAWRTWTGIRSSMKAIEKDMWQSPYSVQKLKTYQHLCLTANEIVDKLKT